MAGAVIAYGLIGAIIWVFVTLSRAKDPDLVDVVDVCASAFMVVMVLAVVSAGIEHQLGVWFG